VYAPRPARLLVAAVAATVLAGCGGEPAPGPAPAASTPAAALSGGPSPAVDRQITVSIVQKKVTPATGRIEVSKGSTVQLTVTSDVADQLHVHGYDLAAELVPGVPASVRFRADTTGLFEVETHTTDLVLFQLLVR
jgi:FtsP/CotA-like multicopper oxidase with cupredoxin domain